MSLLPVLGASQFLTSGTAAAGQAVSALSQSFAVLLRGATGGTSAEGTQTPNTTEPPRSVGLPAGRDGDLPQRLQALLGVFRSQVDRLLEEHGIELGSALRLQRNPFGQIHVAGAHPQARLIDGLLATQPELGDLFTALEHHAHRLHAEDAAAPDQVFELTLTADDTETAFVPAGS